MVHLTIGIEATQRDAAARSENEKTRRRRVCVQESDGVHLAEYPQLFETP
jgi:hypothetical protein